MAQTPETLSVSAQRDPGPVSRPDARQQAIGHLSHEICRPLTAIRSGFELLLGDRDRPLDPEHRRYLELMRQQCDELIGLTRGYLEYAQIATGRLRLHLGRYPLSAFVQAIDRQSAAAARARGLTWECLVDGPDVLVLTDPTRCRQILSNLVSNAIKYTPRGAVSVVLRQEDRQRWSGAVTDTGPGIPREYLNRVFDEFFRLPRDQQSGIEGTGLGLSVCRHLVDLLGGTIRLESFLDEGTRAVVWLPLNATKTLDDVR